jgi:hypothetical protein
MRESIKRGIMENESGKMYGITEDRTAEKMGENGKFK